MGIQNLLVTLKKITKHTNIKEFKGKRIGIVNIKIKKGWALLDTQIIVHKYERQGI